MVPPKTPSTPPSVPWHRRRLTPALQLGHKRGGKEGENDPPVGAASTPTANRCLRGRSGAAALLPISLPGATPRLSPPLLPNLSPTTQFSTTYAKDNARDFSGEILHGLPRDRGGRAGSYDPRGGYPAPALHQTRQAGSPTRSSRRTLSGLYLPRATTAWRRGPQRPVSVLVTALAGSSLRASSSSSLPSFGSTLLHRGSGGGPEPYGSGEGFPSLHHSRGFLRRQVVLTLGKGEDQHRVLLGDPVV